MSVSKQKRVRRAPETTRALILDASERIMVEEGYAAVSTRRVAQELGLNPATIHYYYATTDDLFTALHQQMVDRQAAGLAKVAAAEDPLEALWRFQANWDQSALGVELIALSNHRKTMQPVLAELAMEAREAQARALEPLFAGSPAIREILPPIALATMLVAVARTLANEERIGITNGHAEVRAFVHGRLSA